MENWDKQADTTMELEFPQAAEQFRNELREFIDQELPDWWTHLFNADERVPTATVDFCKKLAKRGWLTMAWPKEFGGQDADIWTKLVLSEEMRYVGEPRGSHYMCLNYIGPLIMQAGTPGQKERFLKPMASGDALWCQGFSEPGAGSDLAAVKTMAIDCGDHFVVNGQKIWTSYAGHAEWCLLVARTDPESKRNRGLSVFAVDMTSPGVTVRPIDSMGGPSEMNEVFFDDVQVPYDCLIGPRDNGWSVIMGALANERLGIAFHAHIIDPFDQLLRYARETKDEHDRPLIERESVQAGLIRIHARWRAARLMVCQAAQEHAEGNPNSVAPAIYKVFATEASLNAADIAFDIMGPKAQLREEDPTAPSRGLATRQWILNIPALIGAGTNEIQRNIIAQQGLGLPR